MRDPSATSPLLIRLPVELKEWLRAEAKANLRTMNAELVMRLRQSSLQGSGAPVREVVSHDRSAG